MQLDFTGLREITNYEDEQAPKTDFKAVTPAKATNDTNEDNKPLHGLNNDGRQEHKRPIYIKGLEDRIKLLDFKEAYLDYRLNQVDKATGLRVDINKGLRDGQPLEEILLMAIGYISNVTGDGAMYNQAKEYIKRRKADN